MMMMMNNYTQSKGQPQLVMGIDYFLTMVMMMMMNDYTQSKGQTQLVMGID